jgi:hypothetical protein
VTDFDPDAAYARIQANLEAERRSFVPSSVMERLVLQVLGCWANMLAEVNASRFSAAGPGADWVDESKLTKSVRVLAEESRVRWPQDQFANTADHAGAIRHSMAHMLYINDITGDWPKRTLVFTRLGLPGQPRKIKGRPAELSWRDSEWSQQTVRQDAIAEGDLRTAVAEIKWMYDCVRAIARLRSMLAAQPELDVDHEVVLYPNGGWWIPWIDTDPLSETTMRIGDIRT